MENHIVWGVLFSIIVLFGLGLFFYNMNSYRKFMDLTIIGKVVSGVLTVVSVVMIIVGAKFAYTNFTYTPPPRDEVMLELEEVVVTSNFSEEDYTQTIPLEEYSNLGLDALFDLYTDKGQADIRSIAKDSRLTRELILRNVGIDLKEDNGMTKELHLLSGRSVDLLDGVDRLIVFADNSQFSASQLTLLNQYNQRNKNSPLDYVVIFPTLSGTQVQEFFRVSGNDIGDLSDLQVVSNDSMLEKDGFSLLYLTQGEYKINNLPAYIFIDKYSVISNAGVGTVFDDSTSLDTFLRRSMTDGNKMYLDIAKSRDLGIKEAEKRLEGIIEAPDEGSGEVSDGEVSGSDES